MSLLCTLFNLLKRWFWNYRFLALFLGTAVFRSFLLEVDSTAVLDSLQSTPFSGWFATYVLRPFFGLLGVSLALVLLNLDMGLPGVSKTPGFDWAHYKTPKTSGFNWAHYKTPKTGWILYDYWPRTWTEWTHPWCRRSLNPDFQTIIDQQGRQRRIITGSACERMHLLFQQLWNPYLTFMVGFCLVSFLVLISPGDDPEAVARVLMGIEELLQAFEMHAGGYRPFIEAHLDNAAVQPWPRIDALRLNLPGARAVPLRDLLAFHNFLWANAPEEFFEEIAQNRETWED